jgi:hypothetical protein
MAALHVAGLPLRHERLQTPPPIERWEVGMEDAVPYVTRAFLTMSPYHGPAAEPPLAPNNIETGLRERLCNMQKLFERPIATASWRDTINEWYISASNLLARVCYTWAKSTAGRWATPPGSIAKTLAFLSTNCKPRTAVRRQFTHRKESLHTVAEITGHEVRDDGLLYFEVEWDPDDGADDRLVARPPSTECIRNFFHYGPPPRQPASTLASGTVAGADGTAPTTSGTTRPPNYTVCEQLRTYMLANGMQIPTNLQGVDDTSTILGVPATVRPLIAQGPPNRVPYGARFL